MNSKNTWAWFAVAAVLFASVYCYDRYLRPQPVVTQNILRGLQLSSVTSVQVIPAGALEIRADRTNNSWILSKPVSYPAQSAAVEALLDALQKLTPATRITAGELLEHRNPDADFGFDSPQISLTIESGDQRRQLLVGKKTPPGDQVFLRVVGVDGAFVADADWLKFFPRTADDWRSSSLLDADENNFDSIVLTNGAKIVEMRRDATNRLWRMTRPLQARADTDRINDALQTLQAARVTQFVTDAGKTDYSTYGLQPADLDLWLGRGTNFTAAIHAGKNPTNDPAQIYAKREGWNAVVVTAKETFAAWHGTVNDFRDPHLVELTAPVAEIEVRGQDNFILQRQGTNGWRIAGEKFPADTEIVEQYIKILAALRVSEFVKDVVTAPDLQAYGLATPARQIILRSTASDSNAVIAQLSFAVQTNGVFAHRADEDFIYSIAPEDAKILFGDTSLFEAGWQFRDRQIWNFAAKDVAQITIHQNGKTRTMLRDGAEKWSLASGSQGMIMGRYIEQTAAQLGGLSAAGWVARNMTEPEKLGFGTNNLQITVELKGGEKLFMDFGAQISNQTALAAVTLDGERWAFVFPPAAYLFVSTYFTIPANVP
jgi:hypothetical protein